MQNDFAYISQRIINTCLRENVCQIISLGKIVEGTKLDVESNWPEKKTDWWLKIDHVCADVLYVPIYESHYMQEWETTSAAWLKKTSNGFVYQTGYKCWLSNISDNLSAEEKLFFNDYIEEANCAVEHRGLCKQAYIERINELKLSLNEIKEWSQQLLFSDQIASYLDHPYYPTARAKFGFSKDALTAYAPEFLTSFELNWIAVCNDKVTLTSQALNCWPTFSDVGLPESLTNTHKLFPVHPLTFKTLKIIDNTVLVAPKTALKVLPTLSVRTVVVKDTPEVHIKIPLVMATLGTKNIRLIKSSTLYDGYWFEKVLTQLEKEDSKLKDLYSHCNEHHGGHVGDIKELAYIVRQYPVSMHNKMLVPVAALASEMPDNRLYLSHLIDHFYQGNIQLWLDEYLTLLLSVHLRLWLKYGIALESNQQNAILAFSADQNLTLVMKDNDSARILASRFIDNANDSEFAKRQVDLLIDQRILVDNDQSLAEMFTTITLQLDIAAIFEAMDNYQLMPLENLYKKLREVLLIQLNQLDKEGVDSQYARGFLLESNYLPAKYLLSSGSLLSKSVSGASDINKFYGYTAPNFLNKDFLIKRVSCL